MSKRFVLPRLPYGEDALAPVISAQTLSFHHGKHHKTYVDTLNNLVVDTEFEDEALELIITATAGKADRAAIFNNAAQAWNHTFFWSCMRPRGGGRPSGDVLKRIEQAFGGFDKFAQEFTQAATSQFGSGWAWLTLEGGTLKVTKTPDAVNPLSQGQTALLACDVWEHAYYLDFQNRRPDFVQTFLDHLLNWEFVGKNLAKAA